MADVTIDKVSIEFEGSATKANKVIEDLENNMKNLKSAMSGFNTSSLDNLVSKLNGVATSLESVVAKANKANSIKINPQINTNNITKGEKDVQKSVNGIRENLAGLGAYGVAAIGGDSSSLTSFDRRITSIRSSIDEARQKIENLGSAQIPTEGFNALETKIESTKAKIEEMLSKEQEMSSSGVSEESDEWIRLQAEIGNAKDELNDYIAKQQEMINSGTAYTDPWASYKDALTDLDRQVDATSSGVHDAVDRMNSAQPSIYTDGAVKNLDNLKNSASSTASKLAKLVGTGIKNGFSTLSNTIKKASESMSKLKSGVENATSGFSKGFMTILKYGLGIRSLYVLFRRLRTAITDSFTQLQNSGAFYETTKSNIDSLKNSLLTLKYQFGAAFEPIFNYIAPALQTLINYLITAMNVLSAFFAKLTGNSTYSKVKSVTAAAAKNTGTAADNAKELNKQLQGFDELNNLTSNSGSSGSGGSGSGSESAIYETAQVADTLNGVGEKLGKIWDVFKSAWDEKGEAVITSATTLLKTMKNLAVKIADTFYTVFTEGYGYKWLTSVLDVVISILNNINTIATAFSNAWDSKGYDMVKSIFEMLTSINQTIATVTDSWSKAWNNHGTEIFENILQTITNINNTIKNISDNFRTAWEEAGVGDSICDGILTIVEDISGFIEDITSATEEWSASLDFYPLLESVDTTIQSIRKFMKQIEDIASSLYKNYILPIVKKITESTIPTILKEVSDILDTITSALSGVNWDELFTTLEQITELGIDTLLSSAKDSLVKIKDALTFIGIELKAIQTFWNWFKGTPVYKTLKDIYDVVNSMSEKKNVFEVMFPDISKIVNRISSITNTLKTLWSWKDKSWSEIGKEIVNGFVNGIKEKLEKNVLVNLFKSVITWVKDLFGVHSPSTVFKAIGEDLIEGLKNGLKSAVNKIKNWIKTNVTDKIKGFFNGVKTITISIAGKVLDSFTSAKELWDDFEDKAVELVASAKEKVNGAIKNLKNQWDNFPVDVKKLWTEAKQTVGKTIEGIKSIWDGWKDTTKNLWTTAQEKTDGLIKTIQEKWNKWRNTDDTKTLNAKATDGGTIASTKKDWTDWVAVKNDTKTLNVALNKSSNDKGETFDSLYNTWKGMKDGAKADMAIRIKKGDAGQGSWDKLEQRWNAIKNGATGNMTIKATDTNNTLSNAAKNWEYIKGNGNASMNITFSNSFTGQLQDAWNSMVREVKKALTSTGNSTKSVPTEIHFAKGGIIGANGIVQSLPQFASGTFDALKHGSVFAAGENGPEVVGHINGRTEVLNRSQIASTMFQAVTNGMRQFRNAQFASPPQIALSGGAIASMGSFNSGYGNDALIAEQNELLAEQNRLLQQIAQKDVSISSRDVFNATRDESNNYYNRTGNSPFLF